MANLNIDFNKLKNIKLTKEQQQYIGVGLLLAGLAVYSYWNFGVKPLNDKIATLEKTLKEKQDNLEKAKRIKGQWEEYNQRLSRVQTASQFLARRLPPVSEYNVGIPKMTKMTLEGGVSLVAYGEDKSANVKSEFEGYKKRVSIIGLTGDYHRLGEFLSRLSGEDLVYNIEDVQMIGAPDIYQQYLHQSLALVMKLVTYAEIGEVKK
jgi:Tfp pilus assembly protein PilO